MGSFLFFEGLGSKESTHHSSYDVIFLFLEPVECEILKSKIGTESWVGSGWGSQYAGMMSLLNDSQKENPQVKT